MVTLVPLRGTYNIGFRAYIDAGEMTPIERIPCPAPWIERTRRDGVVFGSGFVPRPEACGSGVDSYGSPLLAVVNKMSDVVDTKPLAKRSTDLAWRPAVGLWEDVEREQVGARPARGSAGPAQQLSVRDQVRPSSQVLPHDENRGPGGLSHINIGTIAYPGHGKMTLTAALLQLLAGKRPDNVVAFDPIDKAPQEREGDFLAAAPVIHYVASKGAPRIGVFMNKCDMVDTLELLGRVEAGSVPLMPEIGHDHALGAAMPSAVGTGLPGLGSITVNAPCGLQIGAAEFWTGYTHPGPVQASLPAFLRAEPKSSSSVICEVLIQPIERDSHAICEAHALVGDTGVEPEPGGLLRDIASVADVNTTEFNQTNNPTHNLLRQLGPLLGDLNRYIAWLAENFEMLQPYVNVGARVEYDAHLPSAQMDNPGPADYLSRMITCATRMDGARRTQPERITPPNKMSTQPRSGDHPLPGTFFDSRRGS